MRGRSDYRGSSSLIMNRYARADRPIRGRSIAWLTSLLLFVSLMAPYVNIQTSLASPDQSGGTTGPSEQQRQNTPPPLEGVFSVTVGGDVAQLVGNVALSPTGDGMWVGSAALNPGSYSYQIIVATNTGAVTLGQDGLVSPPANQATFTVPDGAEAATFSFNEFTGAVNAGGAVFEIQTDVGQFQMLPAPQGTYEVFFNSPADTPITIQPLAFGTPTGESAQATAGDSGRIHVALNAAGQIQVAEAVQTATLELVKTDQNGNPLGGACFTVYGGGDVVAGQVCDSADGANDGAMTIIFANGLPDGNVDVVESFTPEGQIVSDPQQIDLSSGAQQLQMIAQVAGEEPPAEETPVEEPPAEETPVDQPPAEGGFTLTFFAVDLNGSSLPGACFAIDGGEPVCDDDGDGSVIIPNVQPGTRTLSEPRSPEGFEPYPDIQIEVTRDEQFSVPHNPGVSAQLPDETATVNFQSVDADGNLLPSACYQLDTGASSCDDDGDGITTFEGLANGTYSVTQTQTPQGFQPVEPFTLEVTGSGDVQIPHQIAAEPEATQTPEVPEEPVGFTIGFVSVDENQNGLPFACYSLDGGDPLCDDDGDGVVTFEDVPAGLHTLTQTQQPEGFENVGSVEVNVEQDANFAVRHTATAATEEPEPTPTEEGAPPGLTVGFVSVDEDDNGLPGACFTLDGGDEVCDDDGDAEVTFTGVQPGTHSLTQTQAPEGYDNVGTLELDLQNDGRFAVRHQTSAVEEEPTPPAETGQIVARTIDQDGNLLPEVCYELSEFGQQCDGDDEDGDMTQEDVPAGEYTVALIVPDGYEAVGETSQTVTVVAGEIAEVEFQVQLVSEPPAEETPEETPEVPVEGAGAIAAVAVEEGFPILDACIAFEGPATGEVCDNQEGDSDPAQGTVLIANLPAGSYQVAMPNPPAGFDPAPAVTADVADGETASVQLEVGGTPQEAEPEETPAPETGNLSITKIDPDGNPLAGACFQIGDAAPVCDNGDGDTDGLEGVIRIEGIPAGDQTVTETTAPEGYQVAAPGTVSIEAGADAQVQVVDEIASQPLGSFRVIMREPDGSRLSSTCIALLAADGSTLGAYCDDAEGDIDDRNGVIEILDTPIGDYTVTVTTVPAGYTAGPDSPMTIVEGERAEVTIMNELATGTLVIAKVDQNGAALGGACFLVGEVEYCDDGESDVNAEPGIVQIEGLTAGSVTITESVAPEGYVIATEPQTVEVVANDTASASFVNGPSSGALQITKTDEGGQPLEGACFLVGETEYCDNGEVDESPDTGTVLISGLPAGPVTITETIAPAGYVITTEPQTVEVVSGDTVSATFVNALPSGSLLITKTDESGELLEGACFLVGEAEYCDNGESDESPDTGTLLISGLPAGSVTVTETVAPAGYAIADEPQTTEIVADDTVGLEFADRLLSGTVVIRKTDESGAALGGACFSIGGQDVCDNGAGDANAEEGVLEVSGIPAGEVTVSETSPPAGYGGAEEGQTVAVADGEAVELTFVNSRLIGSLRIEKTDEAGAPLGGACFTVAGAEICDNGENDINGDEGVIELGGLGAGSIDIVETVAPDGYAAAEATTAEIVANETTTVVIANARQTGTVQIVTASEGGTPLGGACYQVDATEVCDDQEGDGSGDSGVVVVGGIPTGDVTITQTLAPEGFGLIADAQTVTVGADETTTIDFGNVALVGGLRIEKVDENGAPVGGACFAIGAQRICDNDGADLNSESGIIELSGLPIGPLSISETSVPEGYSSDGISQTVQIVADQTAATAFVNARLTGAVRIDKVDQDGAPLGGACFAVGELAVCDDGDGDTNPEPGVIEVAGVPIGAVTVSETSAPEGYGADGTAQTIDISSGETTALTMVNTRLLGTVRIEKTDQDGELLAGACFSVGGQEICDNGDGDTNGDDGVIEVGGVPVGPVDVTETSAPEGYAPTGGTTVQVTADEVASVSMPNVRLTGGVRVLKVDENGEPLAGSCFSVAGTEVCDNSESDLSPDEGVIEFAGIPTGTVDVTESSAPDGYVTAEPVSVDVVADTSVEVTIANALAAGIVSISKTDQDGNPLAGACFTVGELAEVCDNGDGDLNGDDGVIEIGGVPAGESTVTESTVPDGYTGGEAQTIAVPPGDTATASFVNVRQLGSVSISKTDQDGNPLAGACFTVGPLAEVCDNSEGDLNGDDGLIEIANVPVGEVNVVESTPPAGYAGGGAQTAAVVVGETATASFVNVRQLGGVSISKTDQDGNPLVGACFTVGALAEVCDNGEGDLNGDDGVIVINDVPVGEVNVVESTPPTGYAGDDPQTVAVAVGETTTASFVNVLQLGSLSIAKTDQDGNPLAGACFTVGELAEVCDNGDGDLNGDDAVIEIGGVPAGESTVTESTVPDGYTGGEAQTIAVPPGDTATASFVNVRQLGSVSISKTDQDGNPLAGACFTVGPLAEVCDNGEGDLNGDDGLIEIANVPAGEVTVNESTAPDGYAGGEAQTITVPVGETATASFVNILQLGGVSISKTDQDDNPLAGACFTVGELAEICDNGEGDLNGDDGVIVINDVPVGDVAIVESTSPTGYAAGDPQTVAVAVGETTAVSFINVQQFGGLSITKTDQDGNRLAGACFTIGDLAEVCDNGEGDLNGDDGIIEISNVPAGEVTVAESTAPEGYAGGDDQTVTITDGETASASFVNDRQLGALSITKTDQDGNPLAGACFTVGGLAEVCDNGEGDLNGDDGVIDIDNVPVGEVTVAESTVPDGYAGGDDQTVTITDGETASASFVNDRQLGALSITKTDQDGNPLAGACFTVGGLAEVCDNGEGDLNGDDGFIDIDNVPVGEVTVAESTAPDGYAGGEVQTVEVIDGETASAAFVNVRQFGDLTINKTDESGEPIEGSCFTVGELGELCDNGEGDENPDTGIVSITDVPAGSVEVVESTAPAGYAPGAPQTADVPASDSVELTFVNTRILGTLTIIKTDGDGNPLDGSCFIVGDRDPVCDNGDGDFDETAGRIAMDSIPVGPVTVVESTTPDGYAPAADQTVEVIEEETLTITVVNERLTGTLTITKVDEIGAAVDGACFTIGDIEVCDGAEGDGVETPGVIEISGIPTGSVEVVESSIPEGYTGAEPQSVEIVVDEPSAVSFVNTRLTGGVTINKNNEDGDPQGGACFTVGDVAVCDNDDVDLNEAEGVIEVDGIPIGAVDITETSAPEGYSVAAPQSIDVLQGESAAVVFVNSLQTGSVQILKTDAEGQPLAGACFLVDGQEICDGGEGDESETEGTILVSEIEIGPIVVSETSAPEGYSLAAEAQTVEIQFDAVVDVTFVNSLAVGMVSISKTDQDSEPLGGACFTIGETAVCDNQEGDANPADGTIDLVDVPVGTVEVAETSAPENYVAAEESQSVDVVEGETASVTIVNTLAVGTLSITKTDVDGLLLAGACFTVDDGEPVCDNGEGDQNPNDGIIEIAAVPVGSRTVSESQAPEGYVGAAEPQAVEVSLGETAAVSFTNEQAVGTVRILKTADDTGDPLGGACFAIDDGEPVCDNAEGDTDSADGTIAIVATVGEHTVTETQSPEGYDALTPATSVTVALGETVDVPFVNTRFTGSVRIVKTDNLTGEFLAGACFSLDGETSFGPICDNAAGDAAPADGVLLIQGVDPGVYNVTETTTPDGYSEPEGPVAESIVVDGGAVTDLQVENVPEGLGVRPIVPPGGSLAITSVDEAGEQVEGACFSLSGAAEVGPVCDNDLADLNPDAGAIEIDDVPTGSYTLTESTTPAGFTTTAPQSIDIALNETTSIEIVHSLTPVEPGDLRISTLDAEGNPVGGACFAWGSGSQCDNLSGDSDPAVGQILVTGLVAGDYTVTGTEPPPGMVLAEAQNVTIAAGEEASLDFTFEAAPEETGGLEFQLNDDNGNPVEGACVALSEASNTAEDLGLLRRRRRGHQPRSGCAGR